MKSRTLPERLPAFLASSTATATAVPVLRGLWTREREDEEEEEEDEEEESTDGGGKYRAGTEEQEGGEEEEEEGRVADE